MTAAGRVARRSSEGRRWASGAIILYDRTVYAARLVNGAAVTRIGKRGYHGGVCRGRGTAVSGAAGMAHNAPSVDAARVSRRANLLRFGGLRLDATGNIHDFPPANTVVG